jgi:predicted lysophospholipase L1 biosynthesis ABC-type transport system permease subunit
VRARASEIGTLRALGFGGGAVAGSVLFEAILLALIGAVLGTLLAWLAFDGRVVYSGSVFRLHVSAPVLALRLAWVLPSRCSAELSRQSVPGGWKRRRRCVRCEGSAAGCAVK